MFLWFLNIHVVYAPYLVGSGIIATCPYLHLKSLLVSSYSSSFKIVIILFLLISRILIYTPIVELSSLSIF